MRVASIVCAALTASAALLATAAGAVPNTVGDAAATKGAEGARHYEKGRYLPALKAYREAQLEDPESPLLQFNIGDALYKTGDLDGALSRFEDVSARGEKALKAGSLYNMGNVYFQQGQFPQAVQAFRQALEYDWEDDGARANLELALQRLQEQQQPQQSQQGEDGQSDEEGEAEREESVPSGEEKRQDTQPREDEQQQEQQREQPSEADTDAADQGADPESEGAVDEAEGGAMAQREAENLLDAFKDRELEAQRLRYRGPRQNQQKDW